MRKAAVWLLYTILPSLILLSTSYSGFAQLTRGSISGIVSDATGAIMAGVQVTATNKATGNTRQTTTNEVGLYRFAAIEPGDYTVEFQLPGFGRSIPSRSARLKK